MTKITTALLAALVLTQVPGMLQSIEFNQCVAQAKANYIDAKSLDAAKNFGYVQAVNTCNGGGHW